MENKLKGKERWIYKFNILCKQRYYIFWITAIFTILFFIAFVILAILDLKHLYLLVPSLIVPFGMLYPHNVNKKRLEQIYIDLPTELKKDYEMFVKRYAGYTYFIQFVIKIRFKNDTQRIISLVRNYKEKDH